MPPYPALPAAWLLAGLVLLACGSPGATAETLRVGPGQTFATPSQAAAVVSAGDTVLIAPGTYMDCATWRSPGITIAAEAGGPGRPVEIIGPVCGGKALFVVAAPGVTIQGLTFRGAKVPSGNGAGIRAEGGDLTIRRSRFLDNENGILTADRPGATLLVEDSSFSGNGFLLPGGACAHAIYAGHLARLLIHRSRFESTRTCHHVKSRAAYTEVTDNLIDDTASGDSSFLIDIPEGGNVLIRGNTLRKGPRSDNPSTAIALGFEGVTHPTTSIEVLDNEFENLLPGETVFVGNRTRAPAALRGNRLRGPVRPLVGPGTVQ